MTTQDFLTALEPHEDKPLIFDVGKRVNAGYHVTEIKASAVHTMDCGGQSNQWFETTLQVWAPEQPHDVAIEGDELVIQLEPPAVACKAGTFQVTDIPVLSEASGCCAPNGAAPGACCA